MEGIRVLYVTTVALHTQVLHLPWIYRLRELGAIPIGVAADIENSPECVEAFCAVHNVPFSRRPFSLRQYFATGKKLRLLAERYGVRIVHVQTPVAGFLTRLAFRNISDRGPIALIYTAHGFHFHRDGPLVGNILWRTCERIAARYTDVLCTVNQEDYEAASKFRTAAGGKVLLIPGNGIDCRRFRPEQYSAEKVAQIRAELNVGATDKIVLMVGEFIPRKRHADALRAVAHLRKSPLLLVLVGSGRLYEKTKRLAVSLGIANRCRFLGFRKDVSELLAASEIVWHPSEQEGLPASVMEALAMERPVIGANVRGTRDLLKDGCGLLYAVGDWRSLATCALEVLQKPEAGTEMGRCGRRKVLTHFSIEVVFRALESCYLTALNRREARNSRPGVTRSEPAPSNHS